MGEWFQGGSIPPHPLINNQYQFNTIKNEDNTRFIRNFR